MATAEPAKISKALSQKFRSFLINHPPSAFNRRLRALFMDYLIQQEKTGFPLDFNLLLWELSDLFELLDCAEDEWERGKTPSPSLASVD